MDFKATIGRVNESWRKLAPTLDKAALKHIGDKEDKNGILLGCFTASYYKRSHLIQGSEVLYAYVFKAFRQDQDESEIRYPTWLLFSPSKEFEADPNLYKPIADQLLALPLSQPKERDLKKLSYAISDNFADAAYLELPPSLTGGKLVYLSIIYCRSNTMDPPRKGSDERFLDALCRLKPSRLVYISCDPSTLARDVAYIQKSYRIESIQPVDMFPQSFHGDGRLRGEFIPLMLGEHNYQLFKDIKATWDAQNIFNPGKIVNTPAMPAA